MLILARRINESIVIGDDIRVTVIDIKGDQIKLGIEAPRDVKVYRREVYEAIQEENREAAKSAAGGPHPRRCRRSNGATTSRRRAPRPEVRRSPIRERRSRDLGVASSHVVGPCIDRIVPPPPQAEPREPSNAGAHPASGRVDDQRAASAPHASENRSAHGSAWGPVTITSCGGPACDPFVSPTKSRAACLAASRRALAAEVQVVGQSAAPRGTPRRRIGPSSRR